jgi:hypothetical protein
MIDDLVSDSSLRAKLARKREWIEDNRLRYLPAACERLELEPVANEFGLLRGFVQYWLVPPIKTITALCNRDSSGRGMGPVASSTRGRCST